MMRGLGSLSRVMLLGFVRDRTAMFFTILFPLMFLVLFGGLFKDSGLSKSEVLQIGPVAMFDQMPAAARAEVDQIVTLVQAPDREKALDQVRMNRARRQHPRPAGGEPEQVRHPAPINRQEGVEHRTDEDRATFMWLEHRLVIVGIRIGGLPDLLLLVDIAA